MGSHSHSTEPVPWCLKLATSYVCARSFFFLTAWGEGCGHPRPCPPCLWVGTRVIAPFHTGHGSRGSQETHPWASVDGMGCTYLLPHATLCLPWHKETPSL